MDTGGGLEEDPIDSFGNHSDSQNNGNYSLNSGFYTMDQLCDARALLLGYSREPGELYCNSTYDGASCWPPTRAGSEAVIPCPAQHKGFRFVAQENATRLCQENGTWFHWSNYTQCYFSDSLDNEPTNWRLVEIISDTGSAISVIALTIALFIFLKFRSLRCLRNKIHCHLIISFIAKYLVWFITTKTLKVNMVSVIGLPSRNGTSQMEVRLWTCRMLVTVYNYMIMVNFFWMLVEGIYLHTLIVWAYSAEKIKIWPYCILAYGVPAMFVIIWAVVKHHFFDCNCWLPVKEYYYDLLVQVPVLVVLLINLCVLASIVWVLLTKLRASNTLQVKQYKKAVKATFVLLHLLGATYVIFITPYGDSKTSQFIFRAVNAFLQSTQGLAVAIFFCFLNNEVRSTIRHHIFRWNESRQVSTRYSRASIGHGDQMFSSRKNSTALITLSSTRSAGKYQNGNPRKDYSVVADSNGQEGHVVRPMLDEHV